MLCQIAAIVALATTLAHVCRVLRLAQLALDQCARAQIGSITKHSVFSDAFEIHLKNSKNKRQKQNTMNEAISTKRRKVDVDELIERVWRDAEHASDAQLCEWATALSAASEADCNKRLAVSMQSTFLRYECLAHHAAQALLRLADAAPSASTRRTVCAASTGLRQQAPVDPQTASTSARVWRAALNRLGGTTPSADSSRCAALAAMLAPAACAHATLRAVASGTGA